MSNELTFWPATVDTTNGQADAHDLTRYDSRMKREFRAAGVEWDWASDGRLLVGVDLTRPEREFAVGPYTITID